MNEDLTPVVTTEPGFMKRISWGAVFAGLVAALVIQLVLGVIGLSIGASTLEPTQEAAPASGLGLGTGIWLAVSSLVALFAGGWVAGHMAGVPKREDSAMHGFLAWGLATLATTFLVSSAIGNIASGATGLLGRTLATMGGVAASGASSVAREGREELVSRGIDLSDIRREVSEVLKAETMGAGGRRGNEDVEALLRNLFQAGDKVVDAADRQAAVDLLVSRTDMSRAEAQRTVDAWAQRIDAAQARLTEARAEAEERARAIGDKMAAGVARAAGWSALAMILGAVAAMAGGALAGPQLARARQKPAGIARS